MDDTAGVEDALHEGRGVIRNCIAQRDRAERVLLPRDGRLLLHRDREAFQGARRITADRVARLGGAGLGERLLVEGLREGVDRRLHLRGAIDDGLDQLHR